MLSIVIPNHKEPNIIEFAQTCRVLYPEAEIIVANDPDGKGKGWAVRKGINLSTKPIVAIIDGDSDIRPVYIKHMLIKLLDHDIVVGSKEARNFLSKASRLINKIFFGLGDTQTGIKVYKRKALFSSGIDGFAYDVDMLYKAKKAGYNIKYFPVIVNSSQPKKLGVILKTLWDVIKIRLSA